MDSRPDSHRAVNHHHPSCPQLPRRERNEYYPSSLFQSALSVLQNIHPLWNLFQSARNLNLALIDPKFNLAQYLACADQPYITVAPQPFADVDLSLFSNMYGGQPEPILYNSSINAALPRAQSDSAPDFYDI